VDNIWSWRAEASSGLEPIHVRLMDKMSRTYCRDIPSIFGSRANLASASGLTFARMTVA
jgi:hypothetical protein